MVDRIRETTEMFNRMKNKANEFIEIDRKEQYSIRIEKELKFANMSSEEKQIAESVDKGLMKHEIDFGYEFEKEEAEIIKKLCIYRVCKERNIKSERPAGCRLNHTRENCVNIITQEAREILDEAEVKGWNVNSIIIDLYHYNPQDKNQAAIKKIRRIPDPRAVNPLIIALKLSTKHHELILNALLSYVMSQEDYPWEVNTDKKLLVEYAAKYALISICIVPFSKNQSALSINKLSGLIEAVPEFSKSVLDIGIAMASPDPNDRIRGVKSIGRRNELFTDVLQRISKEDPDMKVKEAATMLLKHTNKNNSEISYNSSIEDTGLGEANIVNSKSESFNEINLRDFEAQIEENEDYFDDIIAGLYGKYK